MIGVIVDFARLELQAAKEQVGPGAKKRRSGALARTRYARLRHKIRAIYDLDAGQVFSPPAVPTVDSLNCTTRLPSIRHGCKLGGLCRTSQNATNGT